MHPLGGEKEDSDSNKIIISITKGTFPPVVLGLPSPEDAKN